MTTIDDPKIEAIIMERLERSEDKNDIILDLCNGLNVGWPEAEALVERIAAQNADHIVLTQSPILVLMALAIFTSGAGLIVYSVYDAAAVYGFFNATYSDANGARAFGAFLVYLLINTQGTLWMAMIGVAMILGSLRGMQDVWMAIFNKLGIFQGTE